MKWNLRKKISGFARNWKNPKRKIYSITPTMELTAIGGSMKVYPERRGYSYSATTVHKYMNTELGLRSIVRPGKPEYEHGKPHKVFDNKLNQDFTADEINRKWCTDFTYLFLATFRFLKEKCLIHADTSIGIIAFILRIDCSHSISEILIFPGSIFMSKIFVEPLAANAKHPAIE